MKAVKRMFAAFVALAMVLAMAVPAFAADQTGTIKIENAIKDQTYTLYRIFDIESVSGDNIRYKVNSDWENFFKAGEAGSKYIELDAKGQVAGAKLDVSNAAAFAKEALSWAKTNVSAVDSKTASGTTVEFTGKAYGYYLVGSTTGVLCSLNNLTGSTVTIEEKNEVPSIDKTVQENSTENYGKTNDATIGDTVKFKAVIKVTAGNTENYVMHDKMDAGLTFRESDASAVEVTLNGAALSAGADYTVKTTGLKDDCTFEIEFAKELTAGDTIIVTYTAELNERAVVGGTGNLNKTKLVYGDTHETEWSQTRTYAWTMPIYKYTMNGENKTPLAGAQFVLYRGTGENVQYAKADTNGKLTGWTADKEAATVLTSNASGELSFSGLDAGTYYLEEIEAPDGYNKLVDPVEVTITAGDINSATNEAGAAKVNNGTREEVENNKGTVLPSTGGMGTTIFYVVGGGLMVAAIVLLLVKKRGENKN